MEHLSRMIDLATGMRWPGASGSTIQSLARQELQTIRKLIDPYVGSSNLDEYSSAHLMDVNERVARALEASYLRND